MKNDAHSRQHTDTLICDYIEIYNHALSTNKERFPFKQIFNAVKNTWPQRHIMLSVVQSEQKYIITFDPVYGRITCTPHDTYKNCKCNGQWIIEKSHLEDVLKTPEFYIQNPARLYWQWLYE